MYPAGTYLPGWRAPNWGQRPPRPFMKGRSRHIIIITEVCHNKSAFWLRRQIDGEMSQTAEQQWQPISDNEVTMCLKRMGNWKSPGPDQVYGFWVKPIICLHSDLTRNYNLLVQDPDSVPDWLSQGITTLIPKNDKTDQAKNYSPITCLSVFYKTLT